MYINDSWYQTNKDRKDDTVQYMQKKDHQVRSLIGPSQKHPRRKKKSG